MAKDIGGVWRTVGGRRIFIKEGQDLASAMKASGKFKKKENNSRTQYYNDIQNAKTEDDLQKILAEHDSVRTNTREESKRFMKEWSERAKEIRSNVDEIAKDKKLLAQIQEETDSMAYKELLDEYNAGKVTTADLEDTLKTLKQFNGDNDEYEYNLYKQAKENPDSINPMTEMSTDWEDLDKRFKDRYEKENQKWLTEKDSNWLKNQGHDTELEKKIKNFKPSGDIESDERRLEDISSNYFYDEVGIYNENIDSTATKWAHDKAVELNDKNKQKKTEMLVPIDPYKPEDEARKILGLDSKYQISDLMTAEQLKGKNREEQKEINKQYLKEQNKLAQEKNDSDFAKEWYEGTKKTENMARENLERAKRNGASVEDLSNRTKQIHELELETQKAQEHANKMSARANSNNLENKYKISKTNDGKEYMRTISPYDETEYAYAEKRNDSWYVKDPTKKTSSGSSQTHIYNDVNEARAKMEEINNRIKGNSENSGKNYEGVTYNNYKKEEVNEASVDHRNEVKTSSDVMNTNIRNAYQEYKKKHPGSKINFSKFKDNYKS